MTLYAKKLCKTGEWEIFLSNFFRTNWVLIIDIKIFSIVENVGAKCRVSSKKLNANISKTMRVLEKIYTAQIEKTWVPNIGTLKWGCLKRIIQNKLEQSGCLRNIQLVFRICSNIFSLTSCTSPNLIIRSLLNLPLSLHYFSFIYFYIDKVWNFTLDYCSSMFFFVSGKNMELLNSICKNNHFCMKLETQIQHRMIA